MKGRNKKTKQRKRRRKTNKRRRKRSMKGGIRPRTQSEEDAEMRINEQEIPSRTYHEWVEEEHGNLQEFLNRPYISMGDIIFYSSGNQFSDEELIVVPDSNGHKTLRNYATYQTSDEEGEKKEEERPRTPDTNKQGNKKGGKKTRKRRRKRKRKTNKRRRKRLMKGGTFYSENELNKDIDGCKKILNHYGQSEYDKCIDLLSNTGWPPAASTPLSSQRLAAS